MRHFALIGEHLGHSASVPIHRECWRQLGVDADYRLIEIPRDEFVPRVQQLLHEVEGFNITIPYKQDVMPLLGSIDPVAQAMGAVNTVVCGDVAFLASALADARAASLKSTSSIRAMSAPSP